MLMPSLYYYYGSKQASGFVLVHGEKLTSVGSGGMIKAVSSLKLYNIIIYLCFGWFEDEWIKFLIIPTISPTLA